MKVSASFLSSYDKSKDIRKLNMTDVDYIHVDYMDGKFVKNKSLPFRELKKIYRYTDKRLDVHLMAENPAKLIKKFASLNTEYITIHIEISQDISKLLNLIHEFGLKAGLAIKPKTDVEKIIPYLDDVELILVMSVEPGKGGQTFIEETEKRIRRVKKILKDEKKKDVLISVDGGINAEVRSKVNNADILVSGSFITGSTDFQQQINLLR